MTKNERIFIAKPVITDLATQQENSILQKLARNLRQ